MAYAMARGAPRDSLTTLAGFVTDELARVARESLEPSVQGIKLKTLNAAPTRVYDGLTVLADGTNWNPGSGQGVYTYYGAAWHKLG